MLGLPGAWRAGPEVAEFESQGVGQEFFLPSTLRPPISAVLTCPSEWSFQGPSAVDSSRLPF